MRERRRNNLLVEPPASATGDIAFNLIVFFLVCASVQPDAGRRQTIPRADEQKEEKEDKEGIEVALTRETVTLNGEPVALRDFPSAIARKLVGRTTPERRIVMVKSTPDVEYRHWIKITSIIEEAGGIITLQIEEEHQVEVSQ